MQPMEGQPSNPLKQMRQKQTAATKLLAAQNKQRATFLKEQVKIREAQSAEKEANAELLKTPSLSADIIGT